MANPGVLDFLFGVDLAMKQKDDEETQLEEAQKAQDSIQSQLDLQIAQLMHEQMQKDIERANLERIQRLADSYRGRPSDLPQRVSKALEAAQTQRTMGSLLALQRESQRAMDEESMAVILILNQ